MQRYKLNLFLPVVIIIFIVSMIFVLITFFLHEESVHKEKTFIVQNVKQSINFEVSKEANVLSGFLNLIQNDKNLQNKYLSGNREKLYNEAQTLFKDLNKKIDLTHFYFIKPNGEVFLRVHDENRFGDIVDRYTFKEAKETQNIFYGLEFGLKKNYTLRVVKPWVVDGKLIGYLELGKEIDKIISSISKLLKVETYIAINKELYNDAPYFVKQEMESTFSTKDHYIVYHTFDIPDSIDTMSGEISYKNRIFQKITLDFTDVSKKEMGHYIFLADNTSEHKIMYTTIYILSIIAFFIFVALSLLAKKLTDIKEKEINDLTKKIENKNNFLQKLIDTAPVAIYYKDKQKRFTHINQAFLNTFGYTKDEVIGKTNFDLEPKEMAEFYNKKDEEIFQNPEYLQVFDAKWENKDNTKEKFLISYRSVFLNDKNEIDGIIGIIYNVTEQKVLESELKEFNDRLKEQVEKEVEIRLQMEDEKKRQEQLLVQQSKMASMGEMIGAIAHQWRQPLNALSITKDLIIDDYYDNDLNDKKIALFEDKTNKLIQYMSKTIDDFRNFFLPSKEKSQFNLYKEIHSIYDIVSSQLLSNNIELIISSKDKDIELFSYPNELKQVIINIINNAKDAIIKKLENKDVSKGIVNIDIYQENDKAKIIISDNGGGIREDIMNKIFEPYFTTKFEAQGTGLGLYMAKTIIEKNMDGHLICKNGKYGAIFTLELSINKKNENF